MRKASILAISAVLAALVVTAIPKSAMGKEKTARWHGVVVRISEDGSTYTVRKGTVEKSIHVTTDTAFTEVSSGKTEKNIDKGEIKEGDDVICILKGEGKELVATRISKRLPK